MTEHCSLIYQFNTWKLQAQNMGRTCCAHKLFFVLTFRTIYVHNMFWACSFHVLNWKSMINLLSYCGLVDVRIYASDKDLPVFLYNAQRWNFSVFDEIFFKLSRHDGKIIEKISCKKGMLFQDWFKPILEYLFPTNVVLESK